MYSKPPQGHLWASKRMNGEEGLHPEAGGRKEPGEGSRWKALRYKPGHQGSCFSWKGPSVRISG